MLAVDVSDLGANKTEPLQSKRRQSDLHGPRVVEPRVGLKVYKQTLGERLQSLNTLRTFKERGRTGDQEIETGKPPSVDLVDELSKRD